ncbi:hypothetical protein X797_011235 [Metarhizium robertsii]|uniref:Uncharacterized protein n=1 Tax=Metarhizium robertsii TaxID=568076 RepID=A0A014MWI3_9HYPO|nr:hypothetical protein X797_011235 [Metarhizium robertsii]
MQDALYKQHPNGANSQNRRTSSVGETTQDCQITPQRNDGAYGARAMDVLRNYGRTTLGFDSNACAFSAEPGSGLGTLVFTPTTWHLRSIQARNSGLSDFHSL